MAGEVDVAGLRQQGDQRRFGGGGLVEGVAGGFRKEPGDLLELGPGVGQRLRVGLRVPDPDEDRRACIALGQGGTRGTEHPRARGMADVELVDQAARFASDRIRRGVEGQQAVAGRWAGGRRRSRGQLAQPGRDRRR